jgi:hypothetical protein
VDELHEHTDVDPWTLLKEGLPFRDDGGVDWEQRPFAKRWSMRRMGKAGILVLIEQHVTLRARCYWLRSDAPGFEVASVTRALGEAARLDDAHHWLIDTKGRWVAELSQDRIFTFEFVDDRNTKMLQRLRGLEDEWSAKRP